MPSILLYDLSVLQSGGQSVDGRLLLLSALLPQELHQVLALGERHRSLAHLSSGPL